jgi:Mce-associated membrane protein
MTQPADTSEDTIATDADAGDGTPALSPDARGASRRVGPARWAVIASIVALLAAAAFLGFRWWQAEEGAALRAEAVTKAREYAVMLGTYDYRTFDESLAAVTANSTAEFAAKYEGVAGDLRGLVENGQGTSVARADHAGLESFDGETATVLVFLDQDVTNAVVPDGRTDATRFIVTVERVDDRWLLDGADAA